MHPYVLNTVPPQKKKRFSSLGNCRVGAQSYQRRGSEARQLSQLFKQLPAGMRDSCAQPHLFLKIQWPRQLLRFVRSSNSNSPTNWDGQWCFAALLYCKRFHSHGTSPGEPYPHRSLCTKHCSIELRSAISFIHRSSCPVSAAVEPPTPGSHFSENRKNLERLLMTQCVQQVLYIYTYSLIMTYITSFGWFISPCLLIKKPPLFSLQKSRHVCCVLLCGMFFFRSPGFLPGLCQQGFLALQATGFVSENR